MEKAIRVSRILGGYSTKCRLHHRVFSSGACCSYAHQSRVYWSAQSTSPLVSSRCFRHERFSGFSVSQYRYLSDYPDHMTITLPALSPTMEMGTIVSWEKKEGDHVKEGDLLAEIETDKATMGFEATDEGYLAKIFVSAGTKNIPLGSLLCVMVEDEADVAKFANAKAEELQTSSASLAAPTAQPAASAPAPAAAAPRKSAPVAASTSPAASGDRIKASPYAKLLAREKGVELEYVATASGSGGRIVSADVAQSSVAAPAVSATPAASAPAPSFTDAAYTDLPLSNIRTVIAKRLTEAKQKIPHFYLTVEVAMDNVVQLRKTLNKELAAHKTKLSVNDFVIKAAAVALRRVPECNSSWQETFIRQYNAADISVAVASDKGLITPIVFNSDAKGLLAINADMLSLAEKARSGKLKPQEFQGGSFTISNMGMYGIKTFSAIINPPQSCILAVGTAEPKVIPHEEDGYKTITVMSCTLCCDHRVVDGAIGARWLAEFKKCLEDPYNMLL